MTRAKGPSAGLSSAANSLAVLEFLVGHGEAGVTEVARHAGVTATTSHRLLATLVATGWVDQDPATRKYRASRKIVRLAANVRGGIDVRRLAHERLVALVATAHETGNLAIFEHGDVLYVDKVTSDQPFGIEARVGSRLPAYCTALGKVLVANLPEAEQGENVDAVQRLRSDGARPRPPARTSLNAQLRRARAAGYALDEGEYLPDVFCVAAPVRGAGGGVVAAMSLSVPRSRFAARRDELVRLVISAAAALSTELEELGLGTSAAEFVGPI